MSTISTHILDTARGAPASGVAVCLEVQNTDESWTELSHAWTDTDGRVKPFFLVAQPVKRWDISSCVRYRTLFLVIEYQLLLPAGFNSIQSRRRIAALPRTAADQFLTATQRTWGARTLSWWCFELGSLCFELGS
jgi:hypothetical protein